MKFGHFDDQAREYVIDTPRTPYPWINYLGCEKFFGIISNTAGGYCFYRDARLRRITRYRYNNMPVDNGGRYFYINDNGTVWNPGWKPVKTELDEYSCRHGMGYTVITGKKNGLKASQKSFVPMGFDAEVHQVTLTNESDAAKDVILTSFVEFCLWNAQDDMLNFQRNFSTGEVEVEDGVVYHKTEYRERRNHYSFYAVNTPVDGFDTDMETFLGMYNGFENPQAVMTGKMGNSVASGWQPMAAHQIKVHLEKGEEKKFNFVLGYVELPVEEKWEKPGVINKKPAKEMLAKLSSDEDVDRAFAQLKEHWDNLLSAYILDSSEEKLNRMVNIWNPYQCMVTFNMSRSTSRDGGCYHQYQPLTKKGNNDIGGGFNDDPLWLIAGTAAYIKETGDFAILDEATPYDCNPDDCGTLLEHLEASFMHVVNNRGPHGLPLIGRADWNDCLNLNCYSDTPDESFQTFSNPNAPDERVAESVLIAGMFVSIGPELVAIERRKGNNDKADAYLKDIEAMTAAIEKDGWDGEWFVRAYDAMGNKVGSKECEDGQIYIESQGYCVMAGVGVENGKAEKALESVHNILETKHGIVLLQPAYKEYHLELGEVSSYPPGYKENAGIFCHNNPWIIAAETVVGHGDRAFDLYSRIAPAWREEISDLHKMEPYVYSQMIAGKDAKNFGQAKNSWLTGTAAWNFYVISNYILGIKPDWDGLKIDPCVPHTWDGYQVSRRFRGAIYDITISNPDHVCRGVKKVVVDGKEISGNVLPVFSDGQHHTAEVILG